MTRLTGSLLAVAILVSSISCGCSKSSDREVAELKAKIKALEEKAGSGTDLQEPGKEPVGQQEPPVTTTTTKKPPKKGSNPLDDIVWDTKAFDKKFKVLGATYDADENQVTWKLEMKGSYYGYSLYEYRFLDEDGVQLDKLLSLIDGSFQPGTPPKEGEPVRLTLTLPDKRILAKTRKVVVDRTDP